MVVSGLLVTGRSGTGKTSIVQTVAKSLQEDLKTLTCRLGSFVLWKGIDHES